MIKQKKTQGAEQAALFVLILFLLIVVYITAIPPEEREKLLNTSEPTHPGGTEKSKILSEENIGHLDVAGEDKQTISLKDFVISVGESTEIAKQTSGLAKKTWFSSTDFSTSFDIDDVNLIKQANFVILLNKCKGSFSIYLNDKQISHYNCQMLSYLIDININDLKNGKNIVLIRADMPKSILSKNIVNINSFVVKINRKDIENQLFKENFEIDSSKLKQIQNAKLNMFIDCNQNNVGKLKINLNNYEIYNQKPMCEDMLSLDINPNKLSSTNTLNFFIQSGQITAENIKLYLTYKKPYYRPYYFDIDNDLLNKTQNNETNIHLYLKFTKDTDGIGKEADIIVNDYKFYLSTDKTEFDKQLSKEWLVLGTNYIKIIPRQSMDIVVMKVYYE